MKPAGTSKRRARVNPRETVIAPTQNAKAALGLLSPGDSISMITKGQFSLLDLIFAVLDQTGPAHVIFSTWTMGIRDAERAAQLLEDGRITSLRFLVDRSFPTRQPDYARRVEALFGAGAFVLSRVHAKFAVILPPTGLAVTIRSSMNLNANERWEQADVDVDAGLAAFYAGLVEELGGAVPAGLDTSEAAIQAGLDGWTRSDLRASVAPPVSPMVVTRTMAADAGAEAADGATEDRDVAYWRTSLRDIESWLAGSLEDRSWTATAQLAAKRNEAHRELGMALAAIDQRAAEMAARELAEREPEAVFSAVLETARELPPDLRDRLLAALAHEPSLRVVAG
jgi:hypothetical protein